MSVKGFDVFRRRVGSIREAMEKDAFLGIADDWIEQDFKPYAKQIAPVDTGDFRDSIDGEAVPNQIRVFADTPDALYIEEGTSTKEAQPTIRPALDKTRRKLSERTRAALRKLL